MTTATADPAVDADLGLDLGPDEPLECLHPLHATATEVTRPQRHDGGPATHWAVTDHACFGPVGQRYPVCERYAQDWITRGGGGGYCAWCSATLYGAPVRIIGRIS